MAAGLTVRIVAGVATAIVLWAAAVQPLGGDVRLPPRPNVACDSLNESTVTAVQAEEGFARATYTMCGARLTGGEPIHGAPWMVILGDSYVEARQVADEETAGSRLERASRGAGSPYNVRQYGWAGASPGRYVAAANDIIARWDPRRVVVLLGADDFGADSTRDVHPDTTAWVAAPKTGAIALSALVRRRWSLVLERSPWLVQRAVGGLGGEHGSLTDEPAKPGIAPAVRALRDAYGSRLLLVYLSTVLAEGDGESPIEHALLESCHRYAVQCIALRSAMLELRATGRLARGFANTTIGVGHLNADGHALLAREIWKMVR